MFMSRQATYTKCRATLDWSQVDSEMSMNTWKVHVNTLLANTTRKTVCFCTDLRHAR